ncbi:MAG: division/cell wall cluster transcriptional repressor MraZ [Chloroflexota bacterium]
MRPLLGTRRSAGAPYYVARTATRVAELRIVAYTVVAHPDTTQELGLYFGEYERTVDYKGRVALPGNAMAAPDADWSRVMLVKGDLGCIFVYDLATWTVVLDEAYGSMDDDESRLFMHRSLSHAQLVDLDNLKRITVPAALLEHAQIEKRAVVVGMFNRLELWQPERWQYYLETMAEVEIPGIADLSRARIREVS